MMSLSVVGMELTRPEVGHHYSEKTEQTKMRMRRK
jgi:hypothetical protein